MYEKRFLVGVILCLFSYSVTAQIPFHRGVNLTQWFQEGSARQIQFTRFTKKDFENIKTLGCDVIRLPVNLHSMTAGAPDYALDPLLIQFLDQAVSWSEELNIYLILDNHSFDPNIATQPGVQDILVKVWTQLAAHYKDSSPYLLFEILNEPHGISDNVWGSIQQTVIDAIRTQDQDHFIIVGGSNYNSYTSLSNLPYYTDPKIIYTFHFYDPFLFTHQGAGWVDPPLVSLSNIPFPYHSPAMPILPSQYAGTWIQSAYDNYNFDGTLQRVRQLLDIAVNFKSTRNVPVFCGEFGVYIPNSDATERTSWYNEVRKYLEQNDIPWTTWDYKGGFGLFKANSNEMFNYDMNVPLLEALDFEIPLQGSYSMQPKTSGFTVYDDYTGEGIVTSSFGGSAALDFYDNNAYAGDHAIHWGGAAQYETISFDFQPDVNLSLMPGNDYQLSFWVRANSSQASFDFRFVDTKTGPADHPWRIGKTINEDVVPWNGEWQHVSIPLNELEEKGSWDDGWYEPVGKFQWSAVDRLEVVAETGALTGVDFFFDDIKVAGEDITIILDAERPTDVKSLEVFPNPLTRQSIIGFEMGVAEHVSVCIYNHYGQPVRQIFHGLLLPGSHTFRWHGEDGKGQRVAAGLYLVRVITDGCSTSSRLVVLN